MALGLITSDLTEKTTLVDDDQILVFDSEDIEPVSGLPYWKFVKLSNTSLYSANIASRIYLEMHAL